MKEKDWEELHVIIQLWLVFYGVFGSLMGFYTNLGHPTWEILLVGTPALIIGLKYFLEWKGNK